MCQTSVPRARANMKTNLIEVNKHNAMNVKEVVTLKMNVLLF